VRSLKKISKESLQPKLNEMGSRQISSSKARNQIANTVKTRNLNRGRMR
jgi:hypothetical protein